MKKIIYDFTNYELAMKSLMNLLDVSEIEILQYVYENKNNIDASQFMMNVKRYHSKLYELTILLTSLHVTTNNDACSFIRKFGIIDLQQALTLETPLHLYLKKHGISIDAQEGLIRHHSTNYKIDELSEIGSTEVHACRKQAMLRFNEDYSVYGYIRSDNVLERNKQMHKRPDILQALSDFLELPELVYEYEQDPNNQCYIVKYAVPIHSYQYPTFHISKDELREILATKTPLDMKIMVITWLVEQALKVIHDHLYYRDCTFEKYTSCLKYDLMVYPKQINAIMTVDEYKEQYLTAK